MLYDYWFGSMTAGPMMGPFPTHGGRRRKDAHVDEAIQPIASLEPGGSPRFFCFFFL